jgi:hypothetical protein
LIDDIVIPGIDTLAPPPTCDPIRLDGRGDVLDIRRFVQDMSGPDIIPAIPLQAVVDGFQVDLCFVIGRKFGGFEVSDKEIPERVDQSQNHISVGWTDLLSGIRAFGLISAPHAMRRVPSLFRFFRRFEMVQVSERGE